MTAGAVTALACSHRHYFLYQSRVLRVCYGVYQQRFLAILTRLNYLFKAFTKFFFMVSTLREIQFV